MTAAVREYLRSQIDLFVRARLDEEANREWIVVSCVRCPAIFDVPNRQGRLPGLCPECRAVSRHNPLRHQRVAAPA